MKMDEVESQIPVEEAGCDIVSKQEEEDGGEEVFRFDRFYLVLSSISSDKAHITTASVQLLMREVLKVSSLSFDFSE